MDTFDFEELVLGVCWFCQLILAWGIKAICLVCAGGLVLFMAYVLVFMIYISIVSVTTLLALEKYKFWKKG